MFFRVFRCSTLPGKGADFLHLCPALDLTVTLETQYYLTNRYAVYTFIPWQQTLIAATFSLAP